MEKSNQVEINARKEILNKIEAFSQRLDAIAQDSEDQTVASDLKTFTLLLGSLSAYRKVPGLAGAMRTDALPFCQTEEDREEARKHMEWFYGVKDVDSLMGAFNGMFRSQPQFEQFQSFWDNTPVFDEKELNEQGRHAFHSCKSFAELFRPFVHRQGFLAWDINEQIGLMRGAVACGLIDEDFFWAQTEPMVRRASQYFHSWQEYAMSCICGAVYYMFCQQNYQADGLEGFCDINLNCLSHLFFESKLYTTYEWPTVDGKHYKIPPYELRRLFTDWDGPEGCLATDEITVNGRPVGYMYREEPSPTMPDSGWRFFAGDESDEYVNDADGSHIELYSLNTICNYSPDIIPLLHAPVGTAYFRKNGVLQEEDFTPPEN